jgi:endonuclease/exonuclease/phosphatase (EEP) superfamily protein YafD
MRLRTVVFWVLLLGLLLPAALITYARWAQPDGERWLQLVAFTPLALPAYAAALVLVMIRVVFPGKGLRLVWLLVALVLLLPIGLHAWWYAPQVAGANPPPAEGAEPLTVMTANSLGGKVDALALVEAASSADADLLVVQEITPGEVETLESGGLADVWPYRAGEPREGLYGTMVFSRFELGRATRVDTEMDSWEVVVTTPETDLRLLAVHAWPPTRAALWRADHLAILAAAQEVDLIVGDFNATPDHRPMRALDDAGFRSAAELANEGWQPTWSTNASYLGVGLPPTVQIDHVLISDRLAALSTRAFDLDGSDHRAVVAQIALQ